MAMNTRLIEIEVPTGVVVLRARISTELPHTARSHWMTYYDGDLVTVIPALAGPLASELSLTVLRELDRAVADHIDTGEDFLTIVFVGKTEELKIHAHPDLGFNLIRS